MTGVPPFGALTLYVLPEGFDDMCEIHNREQLAAMNANVAFRGIGDVLRRAAHIHACAACIEALPAALERRNQQGGY